MKFRFRALSSLRLILAASLLSALVIGMQPASADIPGFTPPNSFAPLANALLPSVVNISTTIKSAAKKEVLPPADMPQFPPGSPFEEFFKDFMDKQNQQNQQQPRHGASLGSGFIIDAKNGYVVTNNHVIADADEINVILQDNTSIKAELIGHDVKTDLAVLQIKTDHPLVDSHWGDSDKMSVGDWVLAIGNPFGLGGTVTSGIISARARNINAGPYDDFIQTDAPINRGNSGGPMFNMNGEIIGINTAIFSPSGGSVGIGFAIPSNLAKPVIDQLLAPGHKARRGWLGVRIQGVTDDIAESLNLGKARGALVASVTPDGPAAKGGIMPGDVITEFDGKPIDEMRKLPRDVADTPIDKSVPVTLIRNGKEIVKTIKVAEMPQTEEDQQNPDDDENAPEAPAQAATKIAGLGLSVGAIDADARQNYGIAEDVKGVLVQSVDADGPAGDKGISQGDVITSINQEPVAKAADLKQKVADAKKAGKKSVLLLVERHGEIRFVAINLGSSADKPDAKAPAEKK
jgi:serine protease Do